MIWGWSRGSIFFPSEMFSTFSFRINVNKNKQKNYKPGMHSSVLECVVLFFGEGHLELLWIRFEQIKMRAIFVVLPFSFFWVPKFSDGPSLLFKFIFEHFNTKRKEKVERGTGKRCYYFLIKKHFYKYHFSSLTKKFN